MIEQVTMDLFFNISINRDQQKIFVSLFSEPLVCFYHQHSLKFPTLRHNLVSTPGIATYCKTPFWTTMGTASNWKYLMKWNYHAPKYLWKNQEIKPLYVSSFMSFTALWVIFCCPKARRMFNSVWIVSKVKFHLSVGRKEFNNIFGLSI